MIIACPACGTRYAVPESAIGSEGRTVRCAKCKHSWFQEPAELELLDPAVEPSPPAETSAPPPPAPPTPTPAPQVEPQVEPEPAPSPVAAPASPPTATASPAIDHWRASEAGETSDVQATIAVRALRRGLAQQARSDDAPAAPPPSRPVETPPPLTETATPGLDEPEPPFEDEPGGDADGYSQFDYRAPFTRRRNTLKMWTIAAAIFALLATGTVVAVNYSGLPLPEWLPLQRPTFGIGRPGLELNFPPEEQRNETLANGETIFRVRGTVSNTGRETLAVPNLLVVFSDARERPVGDWVVVPAKRELAPGESVNVTEAIANIPPGAVVVDLGWAPN
jgi:predicted Zn finger-like uncharacterized protein